MHLTICIGIAINASIYIYIYVGLTQIVIFWFAPGPTFRIRPRCSAAAG